MKRYLFLGLLIIAVATAVSASATVLTFDDINTNGGVVAMPANYGGFSWAGNVGVYGFVQPPYNAQSPPNRVLFNYGTCCNYAETDIFSNMGPITFQGAYFAGYSFSGPVYFNLYDNGTLVWTSGSMFPSATPTFLASGYNGPVTEIGVVGEEGYFVMDNFTFGGGGGTPEPASLFLFGSGILGAAGVLRRKFRA